MFYGNPIKRNEKNPSRDVSTFLCDSDFPCHLLLGRGVGCRRFDVAQFTAL